jgi:hypothetical protein
MSNKINADQIDLVASELEGAGTATRQLSIKGGGVTEAKLGFSWEVASVLASAFSYSATRSTYTLSSAASANANVLDNAELLRNGVGGLTRVTTTAADGEWSLSGTTLSIHGDITGNGATYQLRYVVGSASGPGSAGGNMIWLGTVPQQPIHAKSDYFQGGVLDSKWEEWDPLGEVTVTQSDGEVVLSKTAATAGYSGIIQDMPSDDQFCITARFLVSGLYSTQYINASLLIGEDLSAGSGAPSTNGFFNNAVHWDDPGDFFSAASYTNYNTFDATQQSELSPAPHVAYVRWFVDRTAGVAGEVTPMISANGRTWVRFAAIDVNGVAAVTTLTSMGIAVYNTTGEEAALTCDMFRVDLTTDPELPVGGFVGVSVPSTFYDRQDVTVAPNTSVNIYGWNDRKAKLIGCQAFSVTTATVGAYTLALTKDPGGTADNMLSAATFDMTTLTNGVPADVALSSTADDLILDANDVWQATFTSDNAGLDAAGVYFMLTWLVL